MTSSVDLAEKLQKRHSNLTKVIKQYQKDFKTFGKLVINKGKGAGKPLEEFILNDKQVLLLLLLLGNSKTTMDYKKEYVENIGV